MLEFLRKASRTWIAKGLLILLVLSFGVWGVSSSVIGGATDDVVIVGDVSVSRSDFRLAYERQLAQLSRQFGTRLTPEQAKAFGIEAQVFSQLVAGATLDQLAQTMNLGLSEDRLAKLISEDPAFHGVNGQFDRLTFSSVLRNAGLREQDYIANRSQVAVRSQIVEAVSDGFTPPTILVDALKQYANEARSIDYLLLSNANIDPIKAPDDTVLSAWFETKKADYRAPEYRKLAYVKLTPEDIADASAITDEEIRADYDKRKASFTTPETRTIEQLSFADRAAADAAAAKLAAGTTFDALVTEEGKTATDVLLGDFTRDRVPDQAVAEAAFGVAVDGGVTAVTDGSFGPVILRISNIRPEQTRTFEEVAPELRQEIALANASNDILALHDKFEDLRSSGAPLQEAADELKLKLVTVEAVDATGRNPNGDVVADIPEANELLSEAFKSKVGDETLPVNVGRDGFVWFDVVSVVESRDRTLAEVREKVVADWTAEQQATALEARAVSLVERIKAGETLAAIATELGLAVEIKAGLRRSAEDAVLSPAAISAAFDGPLGYVAQAPGIGNDGRILVVVTGVDDSSPVDALDNTDRQIEATARASGDDILDQMVTALQTSYGVSINQTAADQAITQQQ